MAVFTNPVAAARRSRTLRRPQEPIPSAPYRSAAAKWFTSSILIIGVILVCAVDVAAAVPPRPRHMADTGKQLTPAQASRSNAAAPQRTKHRKSARRSHPTGQAANQRQVPPEWNWFPASATLFIPASRHVGAPPVTPEQRPPDGPAIAATDAPIDSRQRLQLLLVRFQKRASRRSTEAARLGKPWPLVPPPEISNTSAVAAHSARHGPDACVTRPTSELTDRATASSTSTPHDGRAAVPLPTTKSARARLQISVGANSCDVSGSVHGGGHSLDINGQSEIKRATGSTVSMAWHEPRRDRLHLRWQSAKHRGRLTREAQIDNRSYPTASELSREASVLETGAARTIVDRKNTQLALEYGVQWHHYDLNIDDVRPGGMRRGTVSQRFTVPYFGVEARQKSARSVAIATRIGLSVGELGFEGARLKDGRIGIQFQMPSSGTVNPSRSEWMVEAGYRDCRLDATSAGIDSTSAQRGAYIEISSVF